MSPSDYARGRLDGERETVRRFWAAVCEVEACRAEATAALLQSHSGHTVCEDFGRKRRGFTPDDARRHQEQAAQLRAWAAEPDEAPVRPAVLSYLSRDGSLRLPPRVVEHLGLTEGGGVSFETREGRRVEIVRDEDWIAELLGAPQS